MKKSDEEKITKQDDTAVCHKCGVFLWMRKILKNSTQQHKMGG